MSYLSHCIPVISLIALSLYLQLIMSLFLYNSVPHEHKWPFQKILFFAQLFFCYKVWLCLSCGMRLELKLSFIRGDSVLLLYCTSKHMQDHMLPCNSVSATYITIQELWVRLVACYCVSLFSCVISSRVSTGPHSEVLHVVACFQYGYWSKYWA